MYRLLFYPLLVLGIATVAWLPVLPNVSLLVAISFVFMLLCYIASGRLQHGLLLLCALLIGMSWATWRAEERLSQRLTPQSEGKPIVLLITVRDLADYTPYATRFRATVHQAFNPDVSVPPTIMLSDYRRLKWPAGSTWKITVKLKRPLATLNEAGFDAESWYWSEGIGAIGYVQPNRQSLGYASDLLARIDQVREWLLHRVEAVGQSNPRGAGLVAALTVGAKHLIADDDWQMFRNTGLIHLMSISGVHVTFVASLVAMLSAWILRRYPTVHVPSKVIVMLVGVMVALVYSLLAGWSLATQRTFYMLAISGFMLSCKRALPTMQIWWIALSLILLIDPFAVLTPGLWLSFGLVWILIAVTQYRCQILSKWRGMWSGQWAVTIASMVMLPAFFGALPILSPLFNVAAIPFVGLVLTPLSLLALLFPFDIVLRLTIELSGYFLWVLDRLATFGILWSVATPPWFLVVLAVMGGLWHLLPKGISGRWVGLLFIIPMLSYQIPKPAMGAATVHLIDVGQGLSLLVQTAKHSLLYDTGFGNAQRILLPQLNRLSIRSLDAVIVSHHDSDHDGALPSLVANMPIKALLAGQPSTVRSIYPQVKACQAGQHWVWDGVRFEVLYPMHGNKHHHDNDTSCVLHIVSGVQSLIVTGDLSARGEKTLVKQYGSRLKSTVLLAGHHGSKTSSADFWIDAVLPEAAFISAGYRNRYRHPHPSVIERFAKRGIDVWRTDRQGAMDITLDHVLSVNAMRAKKYQAFWRAVP